MATREERATILTTVVVMMTEVAADPEVDPQVRRATAFQLHPEFAYDTPMLFEVVVKDGIAFDLANLRFMMSQLDAIADGTLTGEEADAGFKTRLSETTAPQL